MEDGNLMSKLNILYEDNHIIVVVKPYNVLSQGDATGDRSIMDDIKDGEYILILDEVDAYLDPEHEVVLKNLFQTLKEQYQVIIVTHKSSTFQSAESLVGTYFNKKKFTSIPLSLDMTAVY